MFPAILQYHFSTWWIATLRQVPRIESQFAWPSRKPWPKAVSKLFVRLLNNEGQGGSWLYLQRIQNPPVFNFTFSSLIIFSFQERLVKCAGLLNVKKFFVAWSLRIDPPNCILSLQLISNFNQYTIHTHSHLSSNPTVVLTLSLWRKQIFALSIFTTNLYLFCIAELT